MRSTVQSSQDTESRFAGLQRVIQGQDTFAQKGAVEMDKYRCQICGYIYDPEAGDSSAGIAAGTKFEDLPDDWKCPVCGADKDQFEKE